MYLFSSDKYVFFELLARDTAMYLCNSASSCEAIPLEVVADKDWHDREDSGYYKAERAETTQNQSFPHEATQNQSFPHEAT